MGDEARAAGQRVLICAPLGRDAPTTAGILGQHDFDTVVCADLGEVARQLDESTGVILVTQEAIVQGFASLQQRLSEEPAWSDVPIILLTARSTGRLDQSDRVREHLLNLAVNAVVLERPLSITSLLSATRSALRARRRQFDLRDRLQELDAQYNRLHTLLAYLPVGVAFVDRNGQTAITNPAFLRFRPDGTIPSSQPSADADWESLDARGNRLPLDQYPVARALRGEPVMETEFLYKSPSASPLWTRVNAVALRDSNEKITGAIAVILDVDDIKRAQAALAQSAAHLEAQVQARTAQLQDTLERLRKEQTERERAEASLHQSQKMEAVGQLTGGIAHDFNNMLTGIIGSLDIMRRRIDGGRTEDIGRFMAAATTSAQRAAALTQRLLAFSRRQALDAKPVAVNDLVANMRDLLERAVDERITLQFALGDDLPNAEVDPHQLESAVLNLAINARDAMPAGGTLTVETRLTELDGSEAQHQGISPGRYVTVAVRDTGVGMAPDVLEKVFEPFFTTKPLGQGTGLGLSMVYGFAKQSGGLVRIESEPDVGTTVTIMLPTTGAATREDGGERPVTVHGAGERVLVVEDDESVLMLIREVLKELGYQTLEYADPLKALPTLASDTRLDLMISDVGLPGMNGRQLADQAREHRPNLPILFITGYAENAAIRSELSNARMAMLTKPFSIDALSLRIRQMIEAAHADLTHCAAKR